MSSSPENEQRVRERYSQLSKGQDLHTADMGNLTEKQQERAKNIFKVIQQEIKKPKPTT